MDYKYIIIGAGIAGLHIGALLSQHGKVLILEKSKEIGGRAKVVDKEGFKLDFGIHMIRFGPNSALAKSLNEIKKSIEFIKPGEFWAFLDDGTKTIFPAGDAKAVRKSKLVPLKEAIELIIMIRKNMDDKDFESLYDVSLEEWFEKEDLIPEIKTYVTMASSAVQVNPFPERSSAGETLHNVRKVLELGSVFYPRGGWAEIFSRFCNKVKENKGEVHLSAKVNEIMINENFNAIGVKLGDKEIYGEYIISTIPVQQLFTILDERLCNKEFVDQCKSLRPTAGVSIDFCLSKPVSEIDGVIFFEKPLSFGIITSNLSPEVAPPGKSLMTFVRIANVEDIKDKEKAKNLYRELRNTIIRFFPNTQENIIYERPLFFEMIDGVEVNTEQHRFRRPGNQVPGINNLFITGDSVGGEGAGGDVGHTSVRECYEKILKS
jgi:phytoene dehydrogenase-like protein